MPFDDAHGHPQPGGYGGKAPGPFDGKDQVAVIPEVVAAPGDPPTTAALASSSTGAALASSSTGAALGYVT